MYIRTPKRYRGPQRRSLFSPWRFLRNVLLVGLIVVGIGIYQNRAMFQPMIEESMSTFVAGMEEVRGTIAAPPPTPTRDPSGDLVNAANAWQIGAVNDAMEVYVRVLDSVPNDVTIHYRVTVGALMLGNIDAALNYAERGVTANPFSSDAWAIRAWALDWARRPGEAVASALHARELNRDNPRALAYLAEAYLDTGQVQTALSTAQAALELDPNSAEAYRARGLIKWTGLFDIPGALEDIQMAYDIARETSPAMAGLYAIDIAQLNIGQGNFNTAIQLLEEVRRLNPDNTQALFWLGSIYFGNLGDPVQAAPYLQQCILINPNSINCHYLLGRTQARQELNNEAAANFRRAIDLGSQSARHHWWAANSQIALGNCALALEYLRIGYDLAIREGNSQLIADFEAILPLCQADFGPRINPTPTPEPEEEAVDTSA